MYQNKPLRGSIIYVDRGLYSHYGIYENDNTVYQYAKEPGNLRATIHITDLNSFADGDTVHQITVPADFYALLSSETVKKLFAYVSRLNSFCSGKRDPAEICIYSPYETITRAKQRLGEKKYNLITNNCECYALWCKIGLNISMQVLETLCPELLLLLRRNVILMPKLFPIH